MQETLEAYRTCAWCGNPISSGKEESITSPNAKTPKYFCSKYCIMQYYTDKQRRGQNG